MRPNSIISALTASLALVSACTSAPEEQKAPVPTAPDLLAGEYEKVQTGLPPQNVAPGECALYLWSKVDEPNFIFFSKAGTEEAKFWFDEAEQKLTRTGVGGEIFGQQLTKQFFEMPDGRKVELELQPGERLVGGQRVPVASFKLTDAEGWVTVKPAVGVSVCQPEQK